jgi:predicted protein tyrosine phosphatase
MIDLIMNKDHWTKEKNWKKMYTRSEKQHRAKQLGLEYPIVMDGTLKNEAVRNVLFICSKNQWRSPTAEKIYQNHQLLSVRSAGTSNSARKPVTSGDLKWADVVIVMEDKHKKRLLCNYPVELRFKGLFVLGIPDDYKYMDPELVEEIRSLVDPILFPS